MKRLAQIGRAVGCVSPRYPLADLAGTAGVVDAVGFTYLRPPLIRQARRLIEDGVLALRSARASILDSAASGQRVQRPEHGR